MLTTMVTIWAVVAVILVALSIHRSIFVMREEDTIFLTTAEGPKSSKYQSVFRELKRLEFVLKIFSFSAGGLTLLIAFFGSTNDCIARGLRTKRRASKEPVRKLVVYERGQ